MPPADAHVRAMTPDDVPGTFALCRSVLFDAIPADEEHPAFERFRLRSEHLLAADPGATWVAERDGEIAGVSMALVREGVWGLSLFAVTAELQGRGVGRELLARSMRYGEEAGARGWIIMSTSHPGAMRRYASAGFELHPGVDAGGVPDLRRAPDAAGRAVELGAAGIELADAIWREVRGAGIGRDAPLMLAAGARLLAIEDRAVVIARGEHVWALAARDDEAAALALWAALLTAPPGSTASIDCLTGAQQWALGVCVDAGLDLTPHGPLFTRGRLGPLRPYLPSGAYL